MLLCVWYFSMRILCVFFVGIKVTSFMCAAEFHMLLWHAPLSRFFFSIAWCVCVCVCSVCNPAATATTTKQKTIRRTSQSQRMDLQILFRRAQRTYGLFWLTFMHGVWQQQHHHPAVMPNEKFPSSNYIHSSYWLSHVWYVRLGCLTFTWLARARMVIGVNLAISRDEMRVNNNLIRSMNYGNFPIRRALLSARLCYVRHFFASTRAVPPSTSNVST